MSKRKRVITIASLIKQLESLQVQYQELDELIEIRNNKRIKNTI